MDFKSFSNKYTSSIHYDKRLFHEDIEGSIAHINMLSSQGIIDKEDKKIIVDGLKQIFSEIESGNFIWNEKLEDIHMNIESRLYEIIGNKAGKLHTGRSRNDQVATDLRLYVKKIVDLTIESIKNLQIAILNQAEKHVEVIMPGYTHLQHAQPVTLGHHLLAYYEMLNRDKERFKAVKEITDVLPLGSGALAGSSYPIDRKFVAEELGFSKVSNNSMDAVSDRDFVIEYIFSSSLCMAHLSRLAEEIIIWSSQEFGFIKLSSDHTTGSSMMPQKHNPDLAELARGRVGRVYGHLIGMLTTIKGLPLTYNRDLQEDKEGLFDTVDILNQTLFAFESMIMEATFDTERMLSATDEGQMLATDLADYLVGKGIPFREAHGIVLQLSNYASNRNSFSELTLEEFKNFSDKFDSDVMDITIESSVYARNSHGGTSPSEVRKAIQIARKKVDV